MPRKVNRNKEEEVMVEKAIRVFGTLHEFYKFAEDWNRTCNKLHKFVRKSEG